MPHFWGIFLFPRTKTGSNFVQSSELKRKTFDWLNSWKTFPEPGSNYVQPAPQDFRA
jgi:hypothetical protein